MDANTSANERISELAPRLNARARAIAAASPEHDPDDLFQEMALAIIDRTNRDASFISQKDAYILQFATWFGKNRASASRTYGKYVGQEMMIKAEDGDTISSFDLIGDNTQNPERQYIRMETAEDLGERIKTLTPHNQQIVAMIYLGYSQVEIAKELGISKPAVTQRKATIAKTLA